MAIKNPTIALSTVAALIAQGISLGDPKTVIVRDASATVYLGGADVTVATGISLAIGEIFSIDLGPGDDLYCIASAGTPTIKVLATRSN